MRTNDLIERHERRVICAIIDNNELIDSLSISEADMIGFKAKTALAQARKIHSLGKKFGAMELAEECEKIAVGQMFDWVIQSQVENIGVSDTGAEESALAIRDESRKRLLLVALRDVIDKHNAITFEEMQDKISSSLIESDRQPRNAKSVNKLVLERMAELNAMGAITGPTGFPTGIRDLDEKLGGLQPGIVTVFAGRPAMGKSSICLSIAKTCAESDIGVHAFTLEDSSSSYADRIISRTTRVETQTIRRGGITREMLDSMGQMLRVRKPWLVDSDDPEGPEQIIRAVRARAKKNKTRVVIVDYLQVVANCLKMDERDAIRHCMQMFMLAAKRDNMSYVVLSQLNRQSETRADRKPSLADMHGSGAIEQFAKCVVGLYRQGYYINNDAEYQQAFEDAQRKARQDNRHCAMLPLEQAKSLIELLILKNNNGESGCSVFGKWKGEFCEIS